MYFDIYTIPFKLSHIHILSDFYLSGWSLIHDRYKIYCINYNNIGYLGSYSEKKGS